MANVIRTVGRVFDLSTKVNEGSATYIIGDASDGIVGTFNVVIWNRAAMVAQITVKGRSRQPQASEDNAPFLPIPYLKLNIGGAVANNTYDTIALTGDSIIQIPASGLQIALDVVFTSGSGRIYWQPCEGAAA